MRTAIFFDGKNFYKALMNYDPSLEINYEKFAAWVTGIVGGSTGTFVGAYYYTGHTPSLPGGVDKFTDFLRSLELRRGYFVRREPRVRRSRKCKKCGQTQEYRTEKRVDTRLVAELIHYAAVDAFDVAVLASGDQDFVPAVEAVNALGKQVYVGVWPKHGLSPELRVRCFGQINFADGLGKFGTGRSRLRVVIPGVALIAEGVKKSEPAVVVIETSAPGMATELPISATLTELVQAESSPLSAAPVETTAEPEVPGVQDEAVLDELRGAEARLPHVSRWYFENIWRWDESLPSSIPERKALISRLVSDGRVEEYEVTDSKGRPTIALRRVV